MLIITLFVLIETTGKCINMNDLYNIYVTQCMIYLVVGQLGESHMKKCLFCANKGGKCITFLQQPTCQLGKHSCDLNGT